MADAVKTAPAPISAKAKSAVVMVALGADHAAKIYKHLKDDEIEALTLEVAMMQKLDNDKMDDILNEFYEMCLAQKFIIEGGVDYAKDALEKAFGVQNARNVIDKVIMSLGNRSFDFMKKVDPKQLFNFIQNEHPQTIALILAHATPLQASTVLNMLNNEKQVEVIERLAKMDRTSPDIIKEVENALQRKLANLAGQEVTDIGGVRFTATLMNSVDRNAEKFIFDELSSRDKDLVDEIRKLMFVFEDISQLDTGSMQILVRNLENSDIGVALKSASEELKDQFFANMSKRVAEQMREDMEYMRNVRGRDVEAAQQRIVAKVRELEERGELVVARGGEDDYV
jgi:flagellar motor switch protein FliG